MKTGDEPAAAEEPLVTDELTAVETTVDDPVYSYFTLTKSTGRLTHHFSVDSSYRFDLRKKKPHGRRSSS